MKAANLKISKHARKRQAQRRIGIEQVQTVITHGEVAAAGGGAVSYHLTNQRCAELIAEYQAMIELLQRSRGVRVIAEDDEVITEYHDYKSGRKRRQANGRATH